MADEQVLAQVFRCANRSGNRKKIDLVWHDLSEAVSLLSSIDQDLLPAKIADGKFDGIDVAIQLAVRRAGQLVESAILAVGKVGLREIKDWLPAPESCNDEAATRL